MKISSNVLLRNINLSENKQSQRHRKAKVKSNMDYYIHSSVLPFQTYEKESARNIQRYCSDSILDEINFYSEKIWKQKGENEHTISVDGKEYLKKVLPEIDRDKCKAIKATTNTIVFNNGEYYKYKDNCGSEHIFSCVNDRIGQPYSDLISGRQNSSTYQIGKFWSMLSRDSSYMGLYYSREQLNAAGIIKGFFTVQIGNNKQDYFYSNGNAGVAIRKSEYEAVYEMYTQGSALFNKYEVGSIFKINGKEYTLNEDRKLDILYGEDIFDIQFPKKGIS